MSAPQPYSPASSSSSPASLDAPLYGASLADAVRRFFAKYATFSGRASRSEYWWWALVNAIVFIVLYIILIAVGGAAMMTSGAMSGNGEMSSMGATTMGAGGTIIGLLLLLWSLATLVPNLALSVRRLHDANFSGFFYFLVLVPGIGGIIVLVFTLLPPNPLGERFDAVSRAAAVV